MSSTPMIAVRIAQNVTVLLPDTEAGYAMSEVLLDAPIHVGDTVDDEMIFEPAWASPEVIERKTVRVDDPSGNSAAARYRASSNHLERAMRATKTQTDEALRASRAAVADYKGRFAQLKCAVAALGVDMKKAKEGYSDRTRSHAKGRALGKARRDIDALKTFANELNEKTAESELPDWLQ